MSDLTEILEVDVSASPGKDVNRADDDIWEDAGSEGTVNDSAKGTTTLARTKLERKMDEVVLFSKKMATGALSLQVLGPHSYSTKVTTHCYWGGEAKDWWWADNKKGFMENIHASFALYKKKRFTRKGGKDDSSYDHSEEGSVLFDVESYPEYENINPGTVTVEGFGLDAWDYEGTHHPRKETIFVSCGEAESIPAKKLMRRIVELQPSQVGFTAGMGSTYTNPAYGLSGQAHFSDLFSMLNRTDIFVNFVGTSSICMHWNNTERSGNGPWNLLWQIILAKELARRIESGRKDGYTFGFTSRILASLIVADRWLEHVDIVLTEHKLRFADIALTAESAAQSEDFRKKGNEAFSKDYSRAFEVYTEALKLNPRNAVYANNRSAASYELEQYEDSLQDAFAATRIDPKYAKSWSRLGLAAIKLDMGKRAIEVYKQAIAVAGDAVSDAMRRGLVQAKAKNKADLGAIDAETDENKRQILQKTYCWNQYSADMPKSYDSWHGRFEISLAAMEIHSRVHEQQVERLLLFAEKLKWPWINGVQDYSKEAYSNLRGGEITRVDLHDWLFGMTLPGKWFAFKIMSALILCTLSIKQPLGVAPCFDCGLSLPRKSYWRMRTVLGRVLGCMPGVISLCGWIGPCPPVEFIPEPLERQPRHVHLKARQVSLVQHQDFEDGGVIHIRSSGDSYADTRIRPDEELEPWMTEMRDPSNWIIPESPVQQIVFKMDESDQLITYKLFTTPVFVTVPPCHTGPKGAHKVHLRELYRYEEKNIWLIERLKDHTAEDTEGIDVMIINATGTGAELLARAWCLGPCFVCAGRAASSCGLETGVLIWVL
ncbi:hypothetical protein BDV12DRAFT_205626 [Aspergillus spectabilis]